MPNNISRDESKLPKWVQTRLMVLRAQVDVFSRRINGAMVEAFLICDGSLLSRYRTFDGLNWRWTDEADEAIWFVRRRDAELIAAEDEDACFIEKKSLPLGL